jgi:hypothetical protein
MNNNVVDTANVMYRVSLCNTPTVFTRSNKATRFDIVDYHHIVILI